MFNISRRDYFVGLAMHAMLVRNGPYLYGENLDGMKSYVDAMEKEAQKYDGSVKTEEKKNSCPLPS